MIMFFIKYLQTETLIMHVKLSNEACCLNFSLFFHQLFYYMYVDASEGSSELPQFPTKQKSTKLHRLAQLCSLTINPGLGKHNF